MKTNHEKEAVSKYVNSDDAAQLLGISKSTLYKMCHKRVIPFYKPNGKLIFFKRSELEDYMAQGRVGTVVEQYQLKAGGYHG